MLIKPEVGMVLYGYCSGVFGRDSYDRKIVESVAFDYIVVRDEKGFPLFACDYKHKEYLIDEEWLSEEE